MDKKGRRILYELDKDSRASYAKIGKAVGLPALTVRYRVNKMIEKGIIEKFITVINMTKLGYSFYKLQLKLKNVDEKKKKRIIDFLKKSKISWIASYEGGSDLEFIINVKNQVELQDFLEDLHKKFSSFIMKKSISINLGGQFFPRDYLIEKKRKEARQTSYKASEKIEKIDSTDEKICRILAKNSRAKIIDIAKDTGITSDTVIKRIKDLKKRKIISGFTIVINNEKINQLHYKILIYLSDVSKEKLDKFFNVVRKNNKVFAIIQVLANWDYEIDLEVENVNELKDFTLSLGNELSDMIKDYEILRVLEMPKYCFFP